MNWRPFYPDSRPELSKRVFGVVVLTRRRPKALGFLLDAFKFGAPRMVVLRPLDRW